MDEVYATTDVLVFPSIWEEPYGGVVIEAMAAGIPVIVSDRGGHLDIISHCWNGVVLNPYAHDEWKQWILNIKRLCPIHLGKNAQKTMKEKYDLNKIINEIEKEYLKLI